MSPSIKYNSYVNGPAGNHEEAYLYDPALLSRISFAKSNQKFRPHIPGPMNPGPGLLVRPLSSEDFDRGKNNFIVCIYIYIYI